jgi:hypothetical protein
MSLKRKKLVPPKSTVSLSRKYPGFANRPPILPYKTLLGGRSASFSVRGVIAISSDREHL